MPDEIHIDEERKIIEVISRDTLTYEDMEDTKKRLDWILDEKGIYKVIIDTTRLVSVPNTVEILRAMKSGPQYFKIAILVKESKRITRDIIFGETVGIFHGLRIRSFTDREDAKQWLI